MRDTSLLPLELRNFEYYKDKLPLYLQNSYGFIEHFRIWYDLLITHTDVSNTILYLLDIFDADFLNFIRDMDGSGSTSESDYGYYSDALDKIGEFFGVRRNFSCTFKNEQQQIVTEELTLNNEDFLTLIKGQIIKNYCEGTFEQIAKYYQGAGLLVYVLTSTTPATSKLILAEIPSVKIYSDDIKKIFKSGLLSIESMGINYSFEYISISGFLKWDSMATTEYWDEGAWAI